MRQACAPKQPRIVVDSGKIDMPRSGWLVDISIFCDESCHLEHDDSEVMLLGAVWCESQHVRSISDALRSIKRKHGLRLPDAHQRGFEVKWSKVSPAKADFYNDLIRHFIDDDRLNFRAVIVNGKKALDHSAFSQSHDQFYYKMYYHLLLRLLEKKENSYSVYLDIKDTRGGPRTKELHRYLCNKLGDDNRTVLKRVEQIRSDESEILQLTDLILGAVSYYNRGADSSATKLGLVDTLATYGRPYPRDLRRTSYLSERKVNLLSWNPAAS